MKTSAAGLGLIKHFEGLRLKAYKCSAGVDTIGYGHTGGVSPKATCTEAQAHDWLVQDVAQAERDVARLVKVPLRQGQFDALVSFVFNLGGGNLAKSTLLKKLNAGDIAGAGQEFLKWNRAGGAVLEGLTKRRAAEREMFLGAG